VRTLGRLVNNLRDEDTFRLNTYRRKLKRIGIIGKKNRREGES
jgi:hypothetical protein